VVLLLVDLLLWCSPAASVAMTDAMLEACIFILLLLVVTRQLPQVF
jgi:uncharacterized MnhB-related membrane protein